MDAETVLYELYNSIAGNGGTNPIPFTIASSNGTVELIGKTSLRNDYVIAEYEQNRTYKLIRVEPVEQSQTKTAHKALRNPHNSFSDSQIKYVNYQLKRAELPALESGTDTEITDNRYWSRNVTPIRTAESPDKLIRAWQRF